MLAHSVAEQPLQSLASAFTSVRSQTEQLCSPLETEDYVVQPAPFVSPPKWHLAHTSWFFDNFILASTDGTRSGPEFRTINLLFNSYYKTQGNHWLQQNRGNLSRPTVKSILQYRRKVTDKMLALLTNGNLTERQRQLVVLGIHHEKQHQELLLMDIKYILGMSPDCPAYDEFSFSDTAFLTQASPSWQNFEAGLRETGCSGNGDFSFDNESPRHRVWMNGFLLGKRLVRNHEYLAFMADGGYERPELWLSDGWEWVKREKIHAPLYWRLADYRPLAESDFRSADDASDWLEYHPGGLHPLNETLPVSHVSYYEADAFARWSGARLPTEAELETGASETPLAGHCAFWSPGKKICPTPARSVDQYENGLLWQWSSSAYTAYPGYVQEAGALGEYNGKFMCNQFVLRGGCVATPEDHWRPAYRNFYRPTDRWCFSGIRLAGEEK